MQTNRLQILFNEKPCYEIVFETSFNQLSKELSAFSIQNKKMCIVADSHVASLYGEEVKELLKGSCKEITLFTFQAGEESKNLDTVKELYEFLIHNGFHRKDMLLALGGGVTGDMTGFVAATYLRGIDYVQIPTTLLAQADSSIGGKTGVDFDGYKNMVGAFLMPKLVYMNISTLKTLDDRQYFSGFAEIMKHGLIKDEEYYLWLIDKMYEICERDTSTLMEMVYRSSIIKKQVVENDPTEQGERALLNFGHTIGHAIEKAKGFQLLHGECVALGVVCAAYISYKRQLLSQDEYLEIRDMFVPFNLPISVDDIDIDEVVRLTRSDKKMESGHIKFILLQRIGEAFPDDTVTEQEMYEAMKEIYYSGEETNE